jgi:gliding motility-associated-like protein
MKALFLLLLSFISVIGIYGQSLNDSLLLFYEMNGNATDISGNGFHGTLNATPTTDRFGNPNSALSFNGVNEYIGFPNDARLKPNFPLTITFWVKTTTVDLDKCEFFGTDFEQNNYHGCWLTATSLGTGQLSGSFGGGLGNTGPNNRRTKLSTGVITANTWHHIGFVIRSATDMDIYIDCVNAGGTYSGSGPSSIAYSNVPGSIGRMDAHVSLPPYYLQGSMDDFRYWNRALSAQEIVLLCNASSTVAITNIAVADETCSEACDGSLTIDAIGTPPLSFSIDSGATYQSSNVFTNLCDSTYHVIVSDGLGDQAYQQVTVNPGIVVTSNFTATPLTGSAPLNVTFTNTSTNGTGFQWDFDDGNLSSSANPNHTFTAPGTYDVMLVTTNGPCLDTAIVQIIVTCGNSTVINNIAITDETCLGFCDGSIDINVSGNGPFVFSIDSGSTYQSSNLFTGLCPGVYNIVISDVNGCKTYQQVTVAPGIVVTANFSATPLTGNAPLDVVFINNSSNATNYSWDFDDNNFSTAVNPNHTFTTNGVYDVILIASNGNCSDTMIVQIVVTCINPPVINNIAVTDEACEGYCDGSIVIDAIGTPPFLYSIDGGSTYQSSNSYTNLCEGVYNVVVQDTIGCETSIAVTVDPGINVIAHFSGTPQSGDVPLDVTFSNVSSNATDYWWDFDDNYTSIAFDTNYTFVSPGTYDVMLVATNGNCTDTAIFSIVVLDTISTDLSIDTVPNVFSPNGDGINDLWTVTGTNITALYGTIYNRWGQLIFKWDGINGGWNGRTTSGLEAPGGIYYYIVKGAGIDGQTFERIGFLQLFR